MSPAPVRIASAVALTRNVDGAVEVLLGARNPKLRFFGGYWAFPGGVLELDRDDRGDPTDALRACAARELEEETGVAIDEAALVDVGTITTPPFVPVRYETKFFLGEQPAAARPEIRSEELTELRYWRPADALAAWRRGEMLIVPPVLMMLELLEAHELDEFVAAARAESQALIDGKLHPIRFSPGMFVAPLTSRTRPPATTTNTLIVGEQRLYIIDPGSDDERDLARFHVHMAERLVGGAEVAGILLTHHHPDHVASFRHLCEHYSAPGMAHALTLREIDIAGLDTRALADTDELDLGTAPDGSGGWRLEALHTPGHTPGHLAFRDNRYHALVAGDLCSSVSTVMIDPPEGHLATYLDTLRRLAGMPVTTIYPGHGPAHRDGHALIRHYLEHRGKREQVLIDALGDAPRALGDLVPVIYADTPEHLHAMAERSLLAGLIKLEEEGRARSGDDGWALA